jgi:hypothetical protein
MRRFCLRRLWRVNCEALMIASGQNLKRLLQKRGWGRRPFPTEAVATGAHPARETDEIFSEEQTPKGRSVRIAEAALFRKGRGSYSARRFAPSHQLAKVFFNRLGHL